MNDTDADDWSALPPVVTPEEWQQARDALLVKEKRLTRALDALAAERRRLPVVEFSAGYGFDGQDGSVDLLGLLAGRRQLVVYHFMFEVRELFDGANTAHVATLMRDGAPHSVPMWVGVEGDRVAFLSSPASVKGRNLRRDPRASISVTDADRPNSMAQVRDRVGEILEGEAAWGVIDRIAVRRRRGQPARPTARRGRRPPACMGDRPGRPPRTEVGGHRGGIDLPAAHVRHVVAGMGCGGPHPPTSVFVITHAPPAQTPCRNDVKGCE